MVTLGLVATLIVLLSHLIQGGDRSLRTCPPGKELRKNGQQELKCKRCKDDSFSQGGYQPRCKQCRTCSHGYRKKCSRKKNAVCKQLSLAKCMRMLSKHKKYRRECRGQMKVFTQILAMTCQGKGMKKEHCKRQMVKKVLQYNYNSARNTLAYTPTSLPPLPSIFSITTKTAIAEATKIAATAVSETSATAAAAAAMRTLGNAPTVDIYSTLTVFGYDEANYEEQQSGGIQLAGVKTNHVYLYASLACLVVLLLVILVFVRRAKRHYGKRPTSDGGSEEIQEVNLSSSERSHLDESLLTLTDIFNVDTSMHLHNPASDHCPAPPLSQTETATSHQECSDEERQMASARCLTHMVSKGYNPEGQWEIWARSLPLTRPCPQAATVRQSSSEGVLQFPAYESLDETVASPFDELLDLDGCLTSLFSDANALGPENTLRMSQPVDVGPRSVQTFPSPGQTVRSLASGTETDECTSHDTLLQSDIRNSSSETLGGNIQADTASHNSAGSTQVTPPSESSLPNNSTSRTSTTPSSRLDNFTNNLDFQKHLNVRPENVYGNLFTSKGTQTKYNHENTRTIFGYEWNKSSDFTSTGGLLAVPKSDITLEVPRDAVAKGESVCVQAFVSSECHNLQPFTDDDEVVVSPVCEYQMSCKTKWDKHVKIHIPCVQRNPKETFRVRFFQKNASGKVEFGDVPVEEDGLSQELYYVKKEDHVEIFTVHFTGFFCSVCGHTCPLDLLALVFGGYGHHGNEAWITLVLGDLRNSIPEVRQKIIEKEKALNGSELVAERPVRLVEEYDCQSRLLFTLHVRSQAQLWRNADSDSGDQQVRRLRELIKCSCSKQPNVTPSEFDSHHQCDDNLQWVYSCDDPPPNIFSCKILVEHLLNGDVVTPRHDACKEGVTSIIVPPVKLQRPRHLEQMKSHDDSPPMGFGELTSSKKPLFSRGTDYSLTRPL